MSNSVLADSNASQSTRLRRWVTGGLAIAILIPSLWGFGSKFVEFIALYRGDADGAFAISPIVNYLLASFGFLCLFGWATFHGMFRDIEAPKYAMLETERQLDAGATGGLSASVGVGCASTVRLALADKPPVAPIA